MYDVFGEVCFGQTIFTYGQNVDSLLRTWVEKTIYGVGITWHSCKKIKDLDSVVSYEWVYFNMKGPMYIDSLVEIVDCGESNKMIKISGKMDNCIYGGYGPYRKRVIRINTN